MDIHSDLLQQPSLFQCLATAKHGMTDDGVVLAQKAGRKGLSDRLLFKKAQGSEAPICKKDLIDFQVTPFLLVRNIEERAKVVKAHLTGKRIAANFS